jgi:class 3 adenylate cyclase
VNTYDKDRFAKTIVDDYSLRQDLRRYVSLSERGAWRALEHKALGHPEFEELEVGQRKTLPLTALFLDLSNFTRRSFWDDQDDVVDLAHAVLSGFIEAVTQFGGHPLGLRGDGLFAGFGGDPQLASAMALSACALSLDGVESVVNPWLDERGIERVQARAGLDAGPITFVRTGSEVHSEVNPLGFAANFAAKCEKKAHAWEIVVGEGIAQALSTYPYFTKHTDSPKTYERRGEKKYYHFYDFAWRRALPHLAGVPEALAGLATSEIRST